MYGKLRCAQEFGNEYSRMCFPTNIMLAGTNKLRIKIEQLFIELCVCML